MKRQIKIFSVLLIVLFLSVMFAMPATAAVFWSQKYVRFSATAGETLATGDVVTIKDADGYAYLADANDAALRPAVGVIGKGGASGASVEIVVFGVLDGNTSLTESGPGYLSETAGDITQSAPSYSQQIGFAISTTQYLINCQNYFDSSSLVTLGTLTGASPLVLEGASANDYETTLAVTDPTADRTVTLADAGGTVMLSSLATNGADAANAVTGASNGLLFEGATADAYETTLTVTDPTADRTITIPNRTGQVQIGSAASVLTPGAAVTLTVGLSDLYTDTVTDNEDQTITFSGAGNAGDEITIIFTTAGTADEVITFHATLVSSVGTLTLGTDAGKYYVVKFKSNGTHWFEVSRTAVQT